LFEYNRIDTQEPKRKEKKKISFGPNADQITDLSKAKASSSSSSSSSSSYHHHHHYLLYHTGRNSHILDGIPIQNSEFVFFFLRLSLSISDQVGFSLKKRHTNQSKEGCPLYLPYGLAWLFLTKMDKWTN